MPLSKVVSNSLSLTTLAASGAATLSSTLGVTGAATLSSTLGVTGAATLSSTLGVTGVTTVQAGTAALPALTTTGDTNTGIFFPAADTIAFSEGGTEAMRIDSSGNVGIGTSSPNKKLEVVSAGEIIRATSNSGANDQLISVKNNSGTADTSTNIFFADRYAATSYASSYIRGTASGTSTLTFATGGTNFTNIYDAGAPTERMRIDSSGNVGVNSTSPAQYVTSGKVLNLTGTAVNSGPANLYLSGSSATLGRGFNSTEIFGIVNITSASEITRITGSGANGYRAYFKIIITGHTSGVANGTNIKEYYWDGAATVPVQISTYTDGGGTPVISFDNSTTQVCIIKLASSNGTSGFNGVMKVEWMIPIDFASNTWTIS